MGLTGRSTIFLGHLPDGSPMESSEEDTIGVIGPPGCGKTTAVLIPTLLWWDGPVVATSTKSELVRETSDARLLHAREEGGDVYVYDPFRTDPRYPSIHWTPTSGCENPSTCNLRVSAMAAAAAKGTEAQAYWESSVQRVLLPLFHAAAVTKSPFARVATWLASGTKAREVLDILASPESSAPEAWAEGLREILDSDPATRDPILSVARTTMQATQDPVVLESCSTNDLDVLQFLLTSSTLYVVGPSHKQKAIAPLISGLVDSIAQEATDLAAKYETGRLKHPLLLALDEVANIAPLDSLQSLISEGRGRRILTLWATQDLAQLRDRYGPEKAKAIIGATKALVLFGGVKNEDTLKELSVLGGEELITIHGVSNTREGLFGWKPTRSETEQYRMVVNEGDLRQLPDKHAALFYANKPVQLAYMPGAYENPMFANRCGDSLYLGHVRGGSPATPASPPDTRIPIPPTPKKLAAGFTPSPAYEQSQARSSIPRALTAEFLPGEITPRRKPVAVFVPNRNSQGKRKQRPPKAEFIPSDPARVKPEDKTP